MNNTKALLSDIAIMRPILIISIILGHAFTIFAGSPSWPLPCGTTQIEEYSFFNPTLISFALQGFVFISGYLFAYKNSVSSSIDKRKFVFGKVRRILFPSIIFSTLYVILLYPSDYDIINAIYDIFNGAGHLWFLPMLFWCYLFGIISIDIISKFSLIKGIALLIIGLAAYILSAILGNPFRLFTGIQYFIFFVGGGWTFNNRTTILNYFKRKKVGFLIVCWIITGLLCYFKIASKDIIIPNNIIAKTIIILSRVVVNMYLLGFVGSITLWSTINVILKNRNVKIRGDIWFGLYIYHQIIMMLLYYHTPISLHIDAIWLPWIIFIATLIFTYLSVIITLRTRIGRNLIG